MKKEEKAFMILTLAVAAGMTVFSFSFTGGSRTLPLISGIFSSILLTFLIAMSFSPKLSSWYGRLERKAGADEAVAVTAGERKKELLIFTWFIGGVFLVYLLGFIIAIPLFLFLFLRFRAKESWTMSLVLPFMITAVIYGTFVMVLKVPLEGGIFFQ